MGSLCTQIIADLMYHFVGDFLGPGSGATEGGEDLGDVLAGDFHKDDVAGAVGLDAIGCAVPGSQVSFSRIRSTSRSAM